LMRFKKTNDRTWCFWKNRIPFWKNQSQKNGIRRFANADFRRDLDLSLTSTIWFRDWFYNQVFDRILNEPNIRFINQKWSISMKFDSCICGDRNGYTCDSLLTVSTKAEVENQTSPLQQHFIGWFIKAKNPFLHRNRPHGFFCGTKGNTRFM
jgi:lycopene beta-cyclase